MSRIRRSGPLAAPATAVAGADQPAGVSDVGVAAHLVACAPRSMGSAHAMFANTKMRFETTSIRAGVHELRHEKRIPLLREAVTIPNGVVRACASRRASSLLEEEAAARAA